MVPKNMDNWSDINVELQTCTFLVFGRILNLPVDILLVVGHRAFNWTAKEWIFAHTWRFKGFFLAVVV